VTISTSKELEELQSIKKLLMALLVKLGATSEEIGDILRMHPGAVRKVIPVKRIRKFKPSE